MFVKLFGSILDSSIWAADLRTRVLWITMLAMADEQGIVYASVGGLARRAQLTENECRAALTVLESPDEDSRSPEHDGRRIDRGAGGWELLNYAKYREIRTRAQMQNALRQSRFRDRHDEPPAEKKKEPKKKRQTKDREVEAEAAASPVTLSALHVTIEAVLAVLDPACHDAVRQTAALAKSAPAWLHYVHDLAVGNVPNVAPTRVVMTRALQEIAANGEPPSARLFRGYLERAAKLTVVAPGSSPRESANVQVLQDYLSRHPEPPAANG